FLARYGSLERAVPASAASLDVPFVGRNAELEELLSLLEGAPSALALVEGEPGIGKTALLDRFGKTAMQRGMNVVSLRAIPDDARPFAIWASYYSALSGEEFDAFLHRTHGAAADELGAALSRTLPERTVLIVDDAQYLRADALQTLVVLAKHVALERGRVMAIGTRSEGLPELAQRLGETAYTAVALSPLSDGDVDNAIALAGVDLDAAASDAFRKRARGHPLYVKGLLEQLVRSGAMRHEGGRWRMASAEADLELPASLRRLIEARIRSRGAHALNVACALALEPAAAPHEIGHACGLSEMEVLDALDDLLGHRILVEPQTGPRHFAFAHDLLAEAARGMLPSARRTRLHSRFAHVLEASEVRERSIRSAVHFEAAGSFADAARAYLNAAQESAELQAPHATLERTDAGLRCAAQLSPAPHVAVIVSKLLQYRSFAHRLLWNLEACLRDAEQAVDEARASGDPRCAADALVVLKSAINIGSMDRDRAVRVARELGAVAEQLHDEELLAQSLIDEGHAYRIAMDCDRAHPVLARALDAALRSGAPQLIVKAGIQLLSLQTMWWRLQQAEKTASLLVENLGRVDWAYRAHAWLVLAMFFTEIERYEDAQSSLDGVMKILEGAPLKRAVTAPNVARPEIAIRADYFAAVLDAACARWDRGLTSFCGHQAMYDTLLHEARYANLFAAARADLLLGRNAPGDCDAASADLPDSAQWIPETGFQPSHAPIVVRARFCARRGEERAAALVTEALDFLAGEHARLPMGTDAAYARLAQAASEAGAHEAARRAGGEHERLRRQKLEAAGILVSV
ncbi:MAG TPA: AAA family ATPase, partial [Candidatus Baltobacteraceae bacterium]|nr:AAA family ATPase [Candidatus Baltobacteraceae bacterium]